MELTKLVATTLCLLCYNLTNSAHIRCHLDVKIKLDNEPTAKRSSDPVKDETSATFSSRIKHKLKRPLWRLRKYFKSLKCESRSLLFFAFTCVIVVLIAHILALCFAICKIPQVALPATLVITIFWIFVFFSWRIRGHERKHRLKSQT
uniref:Hypothetical secreted peptide n=1 Tax=Rhipicephalus sanguineus TaxID=34632 RepID=C9W1D3_RHISA